MARVIISSTTRRWLGSLTKKRTVLMATLVTSLAFIVMTLKWARSPGPPPGVRSVPRWQRSSLWVEDGRDHVNPHRFAYINNHPDVCGEEEEVDLGMEDVEEDEVDPGSNESVAAPSNGKIVSDKDKLLMSSLPKLAAAAAAAAAAVPAV